VTGVHPAPRPLGAIDAVTTPYFCSASGALVRQLPALQAFAVGNRDRIAALIDW